MKLAAIAVDYDGTLTLDGRLSPAVVDAIGYARQQGIRVILATGRRLAHLANDTELAMFDAVVAENGAVLDFPATGRHIRLGLAPPAAFLDALTERGLSFMTGECVVETEAAHALAALVFNRDRMMLLPAGVTKATGLRQAKDAVRLVTRESEPAEVEALSRLCEVPLDAGVLASLDITEAVLLPGPDEAGGRLVRFRVGARLTTHVRHRQKYCDMPVASAQAFVFTGGGSAGPRARSLRDLVTLLGTEPAARLEGHFARHDISRWIREVFRDGVLAARLAEIERRTRHDPPRVVAESLAQAIRARYAFTN